MMEYTCDNPDATPILFSTVPFGHQDKFFILTGDYLINIWTGHDRRACWFRLVDFKHYLSEFNFNCHVYPVQKFLQASNFLQEFFHVLSPFYDWTKNIWLQIIKFLMLNSKMFYCSLIFIEQVELLVELPWIETHKIFSETTMHWWLYICFNTHSYSNFSLALIRFAIKIHLCQNYYVTEWTLVTKMHCDKKTETWREKVIIPHLPGCHSTKFMSSFLGTNYTDTYITEYISILVFFF